MSNTSLDQVSKLEKFIKETNIYFDKELLTVAAVPDAGVGIFSLVDIARDTIIVKIPKTAIFTSKTCTISNLLSEEGIDGIMGIHLAVLYELFVLKDSKSHWFDYLSFIFSSCIHEDRKDDLYLPPGYWSDEEKALLEGTLLDCQYDGLKPHKDIITIYKQFVSIAYRWLSECNLKIPEILQNEKYYNLTEEQLDAEVSEEEEKALNCDSNFLKFIEIGFIISSRVFEIDCYHLFGLVCVVDLFNHDSKEDIHFENDYDVCDICGKLECGHMSEIEEEEDSESELEANNNEHVCEEGHNHEEEYSGDFDSENEESVAEVSENEDNCEDEDLSDTDQNDCCEIRAIHDIKKGKQIFNTYGKFPNAVLLLKYGFVVENNPYDKVSLVKEFDEVVDLISGVDKADIAKRLKWWKEEGVFMFEEEQGIIEAESETDELEHVEHSEEIVLSAQSASDADLGDKEESQIVEKEDEINDDIDIDTFWKDKIFIDSTGEASPFLERLCVILAMNNDQFDNKKLQFQPDLLENVKSSEIKQLLTLSLAMLKKMLNKKTLFRIPENLESLQHIEQIKKMLLIENAIILKCKENFNLQ